MNRALQGPSPERACGKLISFKNELYMLGGCPASYALGAIGALGRQRFNVDDNP